MRRVVCVIFALLLSAPLAAHMIVLESADGVEALTSCQLRHDIATCDFYHVDDDSELPPSVGGALRLDGRSYIVDWIGPGYYLESGLVLEPIGAAKRGLKGQRWLEVSPDQGRVHTSRGWKDVDGNRALSASDTLALDAGPGLMVNDVRFQVRVRQAPVAP
jgi:hypothetical protein